jgi:hypothetical protein
VTSAPASPKQSKGTTRSFLIMVIVLFAVIGALLLGMLYFLDDGSLQFNYDGFGN